MEYKEMIYQSERLVNPIILATDEYKGFPYYVVSNGTHPCAYVDVSGTKLHGMDYDEIDVFCHGGLTYSDKYLSGVDKTGWYIGWDYAHCDDWVGYYDNSRSFMRKANRWTTLEMIDECKDVIDQIIKITNKADENYMIDYTKEVRLSMKKIDLNEIKITDEFKNTMPTVHKFRDKYYCFRCMKMLPDKIIVDENYTLIDGYISYLLAKAFDWTEIEVIVRADGNTDETE